MFGAFHKKTGPAVIAILAVLVLCAFSGARMRHVRSGWWYPQAYVKTANPGDTDQLAQSISIYGDTLVAGASLEDSNQTTITNGPTASADNSAGDAGAAYVYRRNGNTWVQEAYIKAANANANDWFGTDVAISGDTIVIGANAESSNQKTVTNGTTASTDNSSFSSGAVYIYKRTGTTWVQEAYIKAPNGDPGDYFGTKVAIDGDTIAVSAPLESSNQTTITNGTTASADNSRSQSGAVYIFRRTGTTWAQEAYIKAANADAGDTFGGTSLSISGDTVVVGVQKEDSNQTTITNGTTASSDNSLEDSGAVYVYRRTGTTWAQEAYIKAGNAGLQDTFGFSAAIYGDTIVVGAQQEDSNQNTITNGTGSSANNSSDTSGAVYVYKRTGSTWAQEAYIKASNRSPFSLFGYSVAIHGDTIIAGAVGEQSNERKVWNGSTASTNTSANASGAAYIFQRKNSQWSQTAYFKAVNGESADYFGFSLTIFDGTAAVGTPFEASNQSTITNGQTGSSDNSLPRSGAVYIFKAR